MLSIKDSITRLLRVNGLGTNSSNRCAESILLLIRGDSVKEETCATCRYLLNYHGPSTPSTDRCHRLAPAIIPDKVGPGYATVWPVIDYPKRCRCGEWEPSAKQEASP